LILQGPPPQVVQLGDTIDAKDYIDIIAVTKAPDKAYIQLLEQQKLAVHNTTEGFEIDNT